MSKDATEPVPLPLSRPHLALLLQLPLEVLHLLGVGELASGQLRDQCLLLFQLPSQLPWRWNEGFSVMEAGNGSCQGQARGWSGAPTVLRLQLGALRGKVIEGALGFFQLYAVFIGLVLQCPGHFLQVCLQVSTSR